MEAATKGDDEVLQAIFGGPDREQAIACRGSEGRSPLDHAFLHASPLQACDAVLLLIRTGMEPGTGKRSPGLALMERLACDGLPERIDPAALNEKLPSGLPPSTGPAPSPIPSPEAVRMLIDRGGNLKQRDGNGRTAFEGLSAERRAWLKEAGLGRHLR